MRNSSLEGKQATKSKGHILNGFCPLWLWTCAVGVALALAAPAFGQAASDESASARVTLERGCEPAFDIRFSQEWLCLIGFPEHRREGLYRSAVTGRREVQWSAREVLMREDFLSDTWPVGVTGIRISDGEISSIRMLGERYGAPQISSLPGMLELPNPGRKMYFPKRLNFAAGQLIIRCSPFLLTAARGEYVEKCTIAASFNGLRITVYAFTGFFWDGGPGWPLFLRDYDEDAWQASLDQVQSFLDLAILFREQI